MNPSTISSLIRVTLASISLVTPALAVVNIDYVPVDHANNAADPATGSLYGAVAYAYQIGKYEVTNAQYTAFLNIADPAGANANGIYNTNMGSNARGGISFDSLAATGSKYSVRTQMGNKPVTYVSWYDAARFTNWLHNGQGTGSTESGAYTLTGTTGIIIKNTNASVWIPSEDEWYKAAYYDPTPGAGGGDNYWRYATQSDAIPALTTVNPSGDVTNPGANVANYLNGADWNGQNGHLTTVGSALANNYFGTADQGGNVSEWNDKVVFNSSRGSNGGHYSSIESDLRAFQSVFFTPLAESPNLGFRVATVPEPTSILMTMLAGGVMLARRKR